MGILVHLLLAPPEGLDLVDPLLRVRVSGEVGLDSVDRPLRAPASVAVVAALEEVAVASVAEEVEAGVDEGECALFRIFYHVSSSAMSCSTPCCSEALFIPSWFWKVVYISCYMHT